jgi:uncharacterized RDD family membrane protein YckC
MNKTPIWKHFAAFLYDVFPILGIFIMTSLIVMFIKQGEIVDQHTLWFDTLIALELALYYIYSWKVGGQTIGMRAWHIKIVPNNVNQTNLSWAQAIIRFFIGTLSTILCGAGLFWKIVSNNNQSWMDISSQTKTIALDK